MCYNDHLGKVRSCFGCFVCRKGMALIVKAVRSCLSARKDLSAIDVNRAAVLLFTVSIFLPFYFSLAAVSCIAFRTMVNYRIRAKAFRAPYTKLLFAFLAVSFFVAAAYNNYKGMAYSILIYAVVTCGLFLRSIMTRQLFHLAMDTACAASLWCVLAAVIQKAAAYASAPDYRPVSLFTNANYYGMIIEFVVLIALYRIFTNPEHMSFYSVVIGLNLIGLYLTGSCSSFVAMLSAVLIMLLYKKKRKLTVLFCAVVVLYVTATVLFPGASPRSSNALETTLAQRLSIWSTSLKAIEQTPIWGRGASAYGMIYEQFGGYATYHCHNLALDTLLNFGIAGTVAVCFYLAMQIRLLILRFCNNICSDMNLLCAAALAAVFVHGITDVTIVWIQTGALFFLITSSMGIGSVYLEEHVLRPQLLPELEDRPQTVYLKN